LIARRLLFLSKILPLMDFSIIVNSELFEALSFKGLPFALMSVIPNAL